MRSISTKTIQGQGKRPEQQDAFFPPRSVDEQCVYVLCDGVGGSAGGKLAAQVVAGSFWVGSHRHRNEKDLLQIAERSLDLAMARLANIQSPDRPRPATTLASVSLGEETALAFWIGDTRIYHLRNGEILWRSEDHNLAHHMIRTGVIDERSARTHSSRKILLRSVNAEREYSIPEHHILDDLRPGDHLVLSSDGIFEGIMESDLAPLSGPESDKVLELIEQQCQLLSSDNYTLLDIRL